ncbi:hypothetical protein D9756_009449 [Leucocoprinus leucothites]|uniref:Uncharacterized protein n=1 Tax=Leucocoprinus leucothites TaxID=201217 RepID=A0A8H5CWA1_9AGAR|nr:hypothetical protein D9756_009449 [Leucoagaricus leucothites]
MSYLDCIQADSSLPCTVCVSCSTTTTTSRPHEYEDSAAVVGQVLHGSRLGDSFGGAWGRRRRYLDHAGSSRVLNPPPSIPPSLPPRIQPRQASDSMSSDTSSPWTRGPADGTSWEGRVPVGCLFASTIEHDVEEIVYRFTLKYVEPESTFIPTVNVYENSFPFSYIDVDAAANFVDTKSHFAPDWVFDYSTSGFVIKLIAVGFGYDIIE